LGKKRRLSPILSNSNSLLKLLSILEFLLKPQKTASNKLSKLLDNFVSLAKIPPSLGQYVKSSIAWHHMYPNLATSFANLLEAQFCDFDKNPKMSSSFTKPK
jgi:hypothetical protein